MKRRLATLTIVGAMAIAAMAPATVFAASQGTTTVSYTAGGLTPPGGSGAYYVTIPSATVLLESGESNMDVVLKGNNAAGVAIPSSLAVTVRVHSTNGYTLSTDGAYTLTYSNDGSSGGAAAETDGQALQNATAGASTATIAGTFTNPGGGSAWTAGNDNVLATLHGVAALTKAPTANGTHTDTLTFYVDDNV